MKRIELGELEIECVEETFHFGKPFVLVTDGHSNELHAKIKVFDDAFWVRVFLHSDFGFAGARRGFSMYL